MLEELVRRKLAVIKKNTLARQTEGAEAAVALVRSGVGRRTMEEIRTLIFASNQREARILLLHDRDVQNKKRMAFAALAGGTAFLLMLLGGLMVAQTAREREKSRQLLQQAHDDLDRKVTERTAALEASHSTESGVTPSGSNSP